jgi:O-antigen/teichoic acid export membrane protein
MKRWLRDAAFRSLLRNSGYQFVSRIAVGALGLAGMSFTAHGLGTHFFGLLVLVHSTMSAVGEVVKFQSWQVVIRYGTPALKAGARDQLQHAISFAAGLDVASGIFGMLFAMGALVFLGGRIGIPGELLPYAIAYCTLLPTMASATPTGIFRLFDRFDLLSWQLAITPAIRLVLVVAAWAWGGGLLVFLSIWWLSRLVGDLAAWVLAARELHRRNVLRGIRFGMMRPARELAGAWRFAATTNLTTTLSAAWGPMANLLVGLLLGPEAAGQYRVAASLIEAANKPADMLSKAFYPEAVRLDPSTRKPWRLMLRGAALTGSIATIFALVVVVGGHAMIRLLFGPGFEPAFGLLLLMLAGLMITMVGFPLSPMLYAVDRPGVPLFGSIVSAICYLCLMVPLSRHFGLTGAGVAYVTAVALLMIVMIVPLANEYRRRTARSARYAG